MIKEAQQIEIVGRIQLKQQSIKAACLKYLGTLILDAVIHIRNPSVESRGCHPPRMATGRCIAALRGHFLKRVLTLFATVHL